MKKLFLILIAAVMLVILLAVLRPTEPKPAKFSVGALLPPGKVTPQLISTWDTAVLLAPDGSLWAWGGVEFQLQGMFASPTTTAIPRRIGSDSDWRSVSASWLFTLALKSDGSLWGWGTQPNSRSRASARTTTGNTLRREHSIVTP